MFQIKDCVQIELWRLPCLPVAEKKWTVVVAWGDRGTDIYGSNPVFRELASHHNRPKNQL
jgi:hypothetical protein